MPGMIELFLIVFFSALDDADGEETPPPAGPFRQLAPFEYFKKDVSVDQSIVNEFQKSSR